MPCLISFAPYPPWYGISSGAYVFLWCPPLRNNVSTPFPAMCQYHPCSDEGLASPWSSQTLPYFSVSLSVLVLSTINISVWCDHGLHHYRQHKEILTSRAWSTSSMGQYLGCGWWFALKKSTFLLRIRKGNWLPSQEVPVSCFLPPAWKRLQLLSGKVIPVCLHWIYLWCCRI